MGMNDFVMHSQFSTIGQFLKKVLIIVIIGIGLNGEIERDPGFIGNESIHGNGKKKRRCLKKGDRQVNCRVD
ncbi:unnamed protein product [Orchesella dallaii]|uniref:Uncharacterized protein n=1 Tax=Orchesella dallaii TaxID=48710 RepID=A0ABP1Q9M2_9HEXA